MARNSSKKSDSLEPIEIPEVLLDDRIEVETKRSVIATFARDLGLDLEGTLHFINGLETYVEHSNHDKSGWFPLTIESVELVEIEVGNNFVLGTKARIHYRDKGWKSDKIEDQSIDTEWVEFNGFSPETQLFSISVANLIYDKAKELEGKRVYVRKHMVENEDGDMFRYLAFLREDFSNRDKDDDGDSRSSKRGSSRGDSSSRRRGSGSGRRKASWSSQIDEAIDKYDEHGDIEDADLEMFSDFEDMEDDDAKKTIADTLGVKLSELAKVKQGDNRAEWLVRVFLDSIPDED